MRPPGIGEREVHSAAHLRDVGEHVRPEGVVATQVRALAGAEMRREPERDLPLTPVAPRRIGRQAIAHAQPSRGAGGDHDRGEGSARRGAHPSVPKRRGSPERPPRHDADGDRGCRIELQRVADRLRCERDSSELTCDDDRPEDTGPADGQSESFRHTAVEPRDTGKGRDEHRRQPEIGGATLASAGRGEPQHGADESEAVPAHRQKAGQQAEQKEPRVPAFGASSDPLARGHQREEDGSAQNSDQVRERDGDDRDHREEETPIGWRAYVAHAEGERDERK